MFRHAARRFMSEARPVISNEEFQKQVLKELPHLIKNESLKNSQYILRVYECVNKEFGYAFYGRLLNLAVNGATLGFVTSIVFK